MFEALRIWRRRRVLTTSALPDALWQELCSEGLLPAEARTPQPALTTA